MTWCDRMLLRLLIVALVGWLVAHWRPAPVIQLTTPTQTTIRREVYAGLPPLSGREAGSLRYEGRNCRFPFEVPITQEPAGPFENLSTSSSTKPFAGAAERVVKASAFIHVTFH